MELKIVDLILVDDDKRFSDTLINLVFTDLNIDHYSLPEHFLKNVEHYPKDTKICLDKNFSGSQMNGLSLAKKLHEAGYTRLFLISGEVLDPKILPEYLIVVDKMKAASLRDF